MKDIDLTTKKIQQLNLQTYLVFAKLCQENNLHFFAISGTAIGVHFWQGFIPWDDDMDIAMPIEDFEKFRTILHEKLPEPYAFLEMPWLGGKLHNKNTTLIEAPYTTSPDHYFGIFIDIVPLIGLPDDPTERQTFSAEIKRFIAEARAIDRAPKLEVFTGQTPTKIEAWRQKLITAHPFGTTKYCTDLSCIKVPAYLTSGFIHPKEAKFENTTIPISSHQEKDLKTAYGTLIKDVPASDRGLNHHNFYNFCDLKTPYQYYTKSFKHDKIPAWFKEITTKEQLWGVSSAREADLYKNYCQELEAQLRMCRAEISILRNSKSYKLGNTIMKPLAKVKKIIRH